MYIVCVCVRACVRARVNLELAKFALCHSTGISIFYITIDFL
jgi:hypothetical protein